MKEFIVANWTTILLVLMVALIYFRVLDVGRLQAAVREVTGIVHETSLRGGLREIVGIVEELRIGALKHGAAPITGEQAARLALQQALERYPDEAPDALARLIQAEAQFLPPTHAKQPKQARDQNGRFVKQDTEKSP